MYIKGEYFVKNTKYSRRFYIYHNDIYKKMR